MASATAHLIFDGDCGFCTSSVAFAQRHLPVHAQVVAWQFADLAALGVSQHQAEQEVVWVDSAGAVYGGAQAAARLLVAAGGSWAMFGRAAELAPLRWVLAGLYRLIANNRYRLPGGTPACALPAAQRPGGSAGPAASGGLPGSAGSASSD